MNLRPLRQIPRSRLLASVGLILALSLLFWPTTQLRSDNFVFYFPGSRHVLPAQTIGSVKYLPLLQVLNLLGKVGGFQEKRNSVKVWFDSTELELRHDEAKIRLNRIRINLKNPIRLLGGQWMVPVDFLTEIVPRLTHQTVEYQMGADRVFVGNVQPGSFTLRLDRLPNGARITLQFTEKVSIHTASQNGKWLMFLGNHPIAPLEQAYHFKNPYVTELSFDDQDGVPKLVLTPTTPGLNFYPTLAQGGKVLVADVLKPPPVVAQPSEEEPAQPSEAAGAVPPAGQPAQPAGKEELPATPPGPPLPVVVLDAGHGGADTGGRSRDGILEKDLVAQIVARVRLALLATGNYRIVLTRTGDTDPGFQDRTSLANLARPLCFLTFHAGEPGTASPVVAVFTYEFPTPPPVPGPGDPRPLFIPWNQVQFRYLDASRQFATDLQHQFGTIPGLTVDTPIPAPVRALRSIDAPAVAIEFGRLSPDADAGRLTNTSFQQQISNAIVSALAGLQKGEPER